MESKIKSFFSRIYADYFFKKKFSYYEQIIKLLKDEKYEFLTISNAFELLKSKSKIPDRLVLLRHDIDTDPRSVLIFCQIEKKYDALSTFYFRINTVKSLFFKFPGIPPEFEIGYHYEELADYAKKKHITNKNKIKKEVNNIFSNFEKNLYFFEKKLGRKITSVASHGDFANRKLDLTNKFLFDHKVNQNNENIYEAYDIEKYISARFADRPWPQIWDKPRIEEIIKSHSPFILILTHPRQWRPHFFANTKENLVRFIQGIQWNQYKN